MLTDKIKAEYRQKLEENPSFLSSTSTKKFDSLRTIIAEGLGLGLDFEQVYAVSAGTRPGNLEVRFCQGERSTMHTILGLGFMYDEENSEENRKKLTNSSFVTLTKMLNRGKASYEMILLFVQSGKEVYPTGLIYSKDTELTEKIRVVFNFDFEQMHKVEVNSRPEGDSLPKELKLDNIILYGPPGTGKTFTVQTEYISKFKEYLVTTFHQAFSYEEFVEGLKPILDESSEDIKYTIEKGIFYRACEKAAELAGYASLAECMDDTKPNRVLNFSKAIEEKKTVLLCIDEINRGNVASIFGDLISLIEPSKRLGSGDLEMIATLPYSKKPFGVPANLFIVGTMNTADRSIQLLDSALRRRFKFEELLPDYDVIDNDEAEKVLRKINARVRSLLNKDNQIGHSYLMFANTYCDILSALYNKIIPLLEEYFYNDITKVRFVLNDLNDGQFYIEDKDAKAAYELFLNEAIDDEDRDFYMLNPIIADAIENNNEAKCKEILKNLIS